MNAPSGNLPAAPLAQHQFLPLLWLLFVASGCAALIYEIVWFQLLQLVIGSSAVSLGVLLATFMGGMCLGSVALPRFVSAARHPLRVYALLELGIGACGILMLFVAPQISRVYIAGVGHGLPGMLLRGTVAAICLLPPTLLMGATLPAIARWTKTTREGVSWLGFFYTGNIGGAVFGCLLAGFYLLRVHDMATATYAAVTINGMIAMIAWSLAKKTSFAPKFHATHAASQQGRGRCWPVYVTIALSGLCALIAEVVWTRLLSLMFGPTVYTFSIILAVFLVGLGIGSGAGSLLARRSVSPRLALGGCQALLAAAITWTAFLLGRSLPFWPIDLSLSTNLWFNFQLDLVRCAWAVLPPTILWGASFPLALAAVAAPGLDPGRLVGGVYGANTVGAILGALGSSLLLIAWIGTQQTQRLLIALSASAALLMFGLVLISPTSESAIGGIRKFRLRIGAAASALILVGFAFLLMRHVPPVPWQLVAYGRSLLTNRDEQEVLYVGEGLNASVAVTELDSGVLNFHTSGKIEASTQSQDMRLQRMLGLFPMLFHSQPRSVLVVGCGAGVTAGSFLKHPDIEKIIICEIEPLVPTVASRYFAAQNYDVVNHPRVQIIYDDARHYLLTTREKFDIITSDPIHPWVKGAATLYTKEYFELCKRHLNPGGLVSQWVPLYESTSAAVKSEMATFCLVFPGASIWSNDQKGSGYDVVLLGSAEPMKIDVAALQQWWQRDDLLPAIESLREVGFQSVLSLLSTLAGKDPDFAPWLKDAEINHDRNLRLQYLAGLGLNQYESQAIYEDIVSFRKFPESLFETTDATRKVLRAFLGPPKQGEAVEP